MLKLTAKFLILAFLSIFINLELSGSTHLVQNGKIASSAVIQKRTETYIFCSILATAHTWLNLTKENVRNEFLWFFYIIKNYVSRK